MTFKGATIKKIKLMKSEGLSNKAIALLLDKNEEEIQKSLEEDYKSYEIKKETEEKIRKLYLQGKKIAEISELVGYSYPAVAQRVESLGWRPKKYGRLTKEEREEIYRLHMDGTSAAELANRYNVHAATVFRAINKVKATIQKPK